MSNTSERLSVKERIDVVNEYTDKLAQSGYQKVQVRRIIMAGLKGYEKALERDMSGRGSLHRSAEEGASSRIKKKLLGKSSWFKNNSSKRDGSGDLQKTPNGRRKTANREHHSRAKKNLAVATVDGLCHTQASPALPNNDKVTTVLFVPQTPGGILAERLRQAEKQLGGLIGDKIKMVERGGVTMRRTFHQSNPWAGAKCGRSDCLPCNTGDVTECTKRNILYETSCLQCKAEGKESVYVGESSRSSYERGKEHSEDYQNQTEDSHMEKHAMTSHNQEERPSFAMKVVKVHFSALSRQIHESVRIRRRAIGSTILNSKSEYNRCRLPRLVVETGEKPPKSTDSKIEMGSQECEIEYKNETTKRRGTTEEDRPSKRRRVKWSGGYGEGQVWGEKSGLSVENTEICNKIFEAVLDRVVCTSEQSKNNNMVLSNERENLELCELFTHYEMCQDPTLAVAMMDKLCHTQVGQTVAEMTGGGLNEMCQDPTMAVAMMDQLCHTQVGQTVAEMTRGGLNTTNMEWCQDIVVESCVRAVEVAEKRMKANSSRCQPSLSTLKFYPIFKNKLKHETKTKVMSIPSSEKTLGKKFFSVFNSQPTFKVQLESESKQSRISEKIAICRRVGRGGLKLSRRKTEFKSEATSKKRKFDTGVGEGVNSQGNTKKKRLRPITEFFEAQGFLKASDHSSTSSTQ